MRAAAAVTINRPVEEVRSRWPEAEPPLLADDLDVSYKPAPGERGTEVRVAVETGGGVGERLASVMGTDPQRKLDDALRRFKQVLETGEVVRSEGSPGGTDATQQRNQHPAQPLGSDR